MVSRGSIRTRKVPAFCVCEWVLRGFVSLPRPNLFTSFPAHQPTFYACARREVVKINADDGAADVTPQSFTAKNVFFELPSFLMQAWQMTRSGELKVLDSHAKCLWLKETMFFFRRRLWVRRPFQLPPVGPEGNKRKGFLFSAYL